MKILQLSVTDRHLLFGLLLKKMLSRKDDSELVRSLHRVENLNKKIETLLELYEKELFKLKKLNISKNNKNRLENSACVIVEDDPELSLAVRTQMDKNLFVLEADCALDCLVYARKYNVKVIVMDEDISFYDNYLISRIIYKMNKNIPIIYLCNVSPEDHNYFIANKKELNIYYLKKEKELGELFDIIESNL